MEHVVWGCWTRENHNYCSCGVYNGKWCGNNYRDSNHGQLPNEIHSSRQSFRPLWRDSGGEDSISFSNAWKWEVKVKSLSRFWLFATPWTAAYQAPLPMGFSRQEYWSGVPLPSPNSGFRYPRFAHLLTQSCPSLWDPLDCSPPGSSVDEILKARILEWVAMPPSKVSSRPRDWTYISCVSCTAGGFITTEPSLLIGTLEEKLNEVAPIRIYQKAYRVLVYTKRQCMKMEKSGLRKNLNNLWGVPWCSRIDIGACQQALVPCKLSLHGIWEDMKS